jgi:thiamine-monophosphate kinase
MPNTPISSLSELELISYIQKRLPVGDGLSGDDAATLPLNEETTQIISKDLLLQGVHFDLGYVPMQHLGYKSVAVNLSDLYAMNGKPEHIVLGLGLPSMLELEAFEELINGIQLACETYGVRLIGGDTCVSRSGLVISITAMGSVAKSKLVSRSGASVQQLICVSGNLGAAAGGFLLLQREQALFAENPNIQPDLSEYPYLLERQLKPEPRRDIIEGMAKLGIVPTAMLDVSDGLSSSLHHLCKASGVGCEIKAGMLPIDPETLKLSAEMSLDPIHLALNGGEDYELLFTCRVEDHERIGKLKDVSIIGYTTEDSTQINLVDDQGTIHPIGPMGWDPFSEKK